MTTLVLGWWTSQSVPGFQNSSYMALYGGIGGAGAILSFLSSFAFAYGGLLFVKDITDHRAGWLV